MAHQSALANVRTFLVSVVVVVSLLGAFATAPSAQAETLSPWWGLTSGERPTDLRSGVGSDEVQNLTVSATKGEIVLFDPSQEARVFEELIEVIEGKKTREELSLAAVVPFNAEASVVQEGLQKVYPAGEVRVTGGPGSENGSTPYEITFPGQSAPPVSANAEFAGFIGGEGLSCEGGTEPPCTHTAVVTEVSAGGPDGLVIATAENRGDASTTGTVTIADKLPTGLEAVAIEAFAIVNGGGVRGPVNCVLKTLTCTFEKFTNKEGETVLQSLPPYEQIEVRIAVVVKPGASSGELNTATVSGGGGSVTSTSHPIVVNGSDRFGIEDWQFIPENPGGTIDTQAGSHPFQVTNVVTLNTQPPDRQGNPRPVALPKDISGELPSGFVGNPTPFAQCTDAQFSASVHPPGGAHGGTTLVNECPAAAAIGVATVTFVLPGNTSATHLESSAVPIFNMVPLPGEPARFGFDVEGIVTAFLDASVRSGGDYGVTVTSSNITQASALLSVKLSFWGVPGDSRHDGQRGWECLQEFGACPHSASTSPPPFLVMPTSCGPFNTTGQADSWAASGHPSQQAEPMTYRLPELVDGCNHLPFGPEIRVTPDVPDASTSTGLTADVHVPQTAELNGEALAESSVKDIEVALPEGVAVNPSGGNGLQACSEGLVGYLPGESSPPEELHFTPRLPGSFGLEESLQPGINFCPDASKIGAVNIKTPLLPNELVGAVYLADQNANPFGSLIAIYIVAEDPVSGTVVKLPGEVHLTATGQLVTTFKNSPELPFEDAVLHFFGGERAPLATPAHCGTYTTNATFMPWSGNEAVSSQSHFDISSGPNGSPCPGAALPFSPSLSGGTTNINAGAFSPLTTTISRVDGQQDMQSVQLHMPAGLSGLLSGVKLCPEVQANEGTCGPESLIGETTVSAGVGGDPVSVKGGRVYITEKYAGAPFGLSIVNPVKAGPFDLEHDTSNPAQQPACDCVVVRAKIDVDPHTAALTVTTDPSGSHAIPHLIDGIPVQIQKVNVLVNRAGFTFNPTNCNPLSVTGTIASDEGASSPVSVPFQVHDCALLKFQPKIAVTTAAKTSKANGSSLLFKISYPKGAMDRSEIGQQSWFNEAKFDLPKQLPARLTTIQKACLASVFDTNPAACPAGSLIGHAVVHTPVLPVPLTGPVYFVSHGGAKFPDAVLVLRGYGVTVNLVGETFINGKTGITSATFRNTPDVPFESIEVTLPSGPFSEFGANLPAKAKGSFCGQGLKMPTEFVAQNGAVIHQSTPVAVTGCKKKTRAQLYAAALKACHRKHGRQRAACQRAARKK